MSILPEIVLTTSFEFSSLWLNAGIRTTTVTINDNRVKWSQSRARDIGTQHTNEIEIEISNENINKETKNK